MSYKLVKFQKDYADEFDVYGFRIMSDKEYKDYMQSVDTSEYPIEKYFGSNEQLFFENAKGVHDSLEVIYLNADAVDIIENKLGESFGWFPDFGDY